MGVRRRGLGGMDHVSSIEARYGITWKPSDVTFPRPQELSASQRLLAIPLRHLQWLPEGPSRPVVPLQGQTLGWL